MLDLLKELILEPEKIKKYFLFFVNSILSIIISSKLYKIWFGEYDLILFKSQTFWEDIFQFVITGNFIIVLFLFVFVKKISDIFLETILFIIDEVISWKIGKKAKSITDRNFLQSFLSLFSILKFDNAYGIPIPDKNFYNFYNFITSFRKEDILRDIKETKQSLLSEVYKTFLLFSFVYFFFIEFQKPFFISFFIFFLILTGTVVILLLHYYQELIKLHYDEISLGIKSIKQIDLVNRFISKNRFKIVSSIDNKLALFVKTIEHNKSIYHIFQFDIHNKFLRETLKQIDDTNNKDNTTVIIISSIVAPLSILDEFNKRDYVYFIEFVDENKLIKKLTKIFKKTIN